MPKCTNILRSLTGFYWGCDTPTLILRSRNDYGCQAYNSAYDSIKTNLIECSIERCASAWV